MTKKCAAVFLDRDGVINHNVYYKDTKEWESPRHPEDVKLIEGSRAAIQLLKERGYLLFIVSNQPSYAKGKTTLEALKKTHEKLLHLLGETASCLTDSFYCYHHPQGIVQEYALSCPCRKPSPYFLHLAQKTYYIDLNNSYMIGDRNSDLHCGTNAGVTPIAIKPDHPKTPKNNLTIDSPYLTLLSSLKGLK